MKKLNIILFLAGSYFSFSQNDFGFKVNGGFSQISAKLYSSPSIVTQNFYFVPSAQSGFLYNHHLGKRSLLGVEILFIQIDGKEHMQNQEVDLYGNPTTFITTTDIWRHISYLGLPIYYGFKIKKFTLNIGIQLNLALKSSGRYKSEYIYNGDKITSDDKYNNLAIDSYDFGTKGGLIYNLSKKFAFEATYYYGFNNIYKYGNITFGNPRPLFNIKVQQITLGLTYKFYTKEKR